MNFFFDNNISAKMAKAMNLLDDDSHIDHLQDIFSQDTEDEKWLEYVGKKEIILITRDKKITKRRAELSVYRKYRVGAFILTGKNMKKWDQVKQLILAWEKIKDLAERTARPFAFQVRAKGKIELNNLL